MVRPTCSSDVFVDLVKPNQDVARLGTVWRPEDAGVVKLVDDPRGATVSHAEAALRLLDPQMHRRDWRVILQIAGEALLDAGDFSRAASYLERAVDAAQIVLTECESLAGRQERIWEFRNSPALLSH